MMRVSTNVCLKLQ